MEAARGLSVMNIMLESGFNAYARMLPALLERFEEDTPDVIVTDVSEHIL